MKASLPQLSHFCSANIHKKVAIAAVFATQFIPSRKLSLTCPPSRGTVHRHGSNHSNWDGHVCGSAWNFSWSIGDIFSGLSSLAFITSRLCYEPCVLYMKFWWPCETITFRLQCHAIISHPVKWQKSHFILHFCKSPPFSKEYNQHHKAILPLRQNTHFTNN